MVIRIHASVALGNSRSVRVLVPAAAAMKMIVALGVLIGGGWLNQPVCAQFAYVEYLSGFDADRVERAGRWVRQPKDLDALEEAAKLVFQMRRVDGRMVAFASDDSPVEPGDAVRVRGRATDVAAVSLPSELADLLEMPRLYRVTIVVDGSSRYVITERVPRRWLESTKSRRQQTANPDSDSNDRKGRPAQDGSTGWSAAVEGVVCAVDAEGKPTVLAASGIQWYPKSLEESDAVGVALLAQNGFDAGLLDEIAALQQKPLQSNEREAFYGMLSAAGRVEFTEVPPPAPTGTVELLRRPQELAGHWIRVPLRTVRITRVAVTAPDLLERLEQDHYWQIDTMGSLDDVAVTIEVEGAGRAAGDEPQATFSNRYPVSVAALRLPEALAERIEQEVGAGAVVAMLRQPIVVDGFYYRLWSYDSEFMQTTTGREQFGPLLMASRITLQPPVQGDPLGAAMIGWMAAGVFLVGVAAVIAYLMWTARRDEEAMRRRRAREAKDVQFPS